MTGSGPAGRWATGFLAAASVLILVSSFTGGVLADWILALSAVWVPIALIVIGAGERLRQRRVRVSLIGLALMMGLSAAVILALSADGSGTARWSGLPLAALVMLGGLGLGPLVLVLWSYTATFDVRGEDG